MSVILLGDIQLVTAENAFISCQNLILKSPTLLLDSVLQAQLFGGRGCILFVHIPSAGFVIQWAWAPGPPRGLTVLASKRNGILFCVK